MGNKSLEINSEASERGVIACCFHGGDMSISEAVKVISGSFFYDASLRTLWTVIESQYLKKDFDKVHLIEQARRRGLGVILTACIKETTTRHSLKAHLKALRRCHYTRETARLVKAYNDTLANGLDDYDGVETLMSDLTDKAFTLARKMRYEAEIYKLGEIHQDFIDETNKRVEATREGKMIGVPSGIWCIDETLNGLKPGSYVVVGGQRSQGKTDIAVNLAVHCMETDVGVVFISIEMPRHDVLTRIQSLLTGIFRGKITDGKLDDREVGLLRDCKSRMDKAPFMLSDLPRVRMADIRAIIQEAVFKVDARVAIIDYIGLITPGKAQNREQEVAKISSDLKAIAREFNIVVVALSQLSRKVSLRTPPVPLLDDFRESGSIEQDADVAILISQSYLNKELVPNAMRLEVAKNRNGRTALFELVDYYRDTGKIGVKPRLERPFSEEMAHIASEEEHYEYTEDIPF